MKVTKTQRQPKTAQKTAKKTAAKSAPHKAAARSLSTTRRVAPMTKTTSAAKIAKVAKVGATLFTAASLPQQHAMVKNLFAMQTRLFSDAPSREIGSVKWFDGAKGFGFIVRPSGAEIFVHFTNINTQGFRNLTEGQSVEYTVGSSTKGPAAVDVLPLDTNDVNDV